MIHVESRRKKFDTLKKQYPGAMIIDVTSKAAEPWVQFSPFFPHGKIPIPNSGFHTGQSVEGIWQGLKVFEKEDIDASKWAITNMKGIKRSGTNRGKVLGHKWGMKGTGDLLCYLDARKMIYRPTYKWVLHNNLQHLIDLLRDFNDAGDIVFLDYETNQDIEDLTKPLSHASMVARCVRAELP